MVALENTIYLFSAAHLCVKGLTSAYLVIVTADVVA